MTTDEGTRLGRYEIRSKIGAGGMGEVYLAQDTKSDRKVALKIFPADVAADQERMRFAEFTIIDIHIQVHAGKVYKSARILATLDPLTLFCVRGYHVPT
jgi:serine/threonine protein kinase